ncbi:MAG: DUF624 domain-containing protein [Clostridia bacterium]|nr:DUF624 domain-containing protein [Clostridia bacterium]
MGLFGDNYSKPGPGVAKDAPEKKGIFRYFEMFFRKFWKLLQVNMLHFIASIPFMVIMFFLSPTDFLVSLVYDAVTDEATFISLIIRAMFAVMMFVLFGSGPASAAYAYITRCFTRAEHTWVLSDFKDKFKENFKQGIILSIVDTVFVALIVIAYSVYLSEYLASGSLIWMIILSLLTTITFLYTIMHLYVYQFMVTFKSSTVQLFKNAFIFAAANMPMCIFLLALAVTLNFVMFTFIPNPLLILMLDFIIGISLARFPIEYSASRAISKKILSTLEQKEDGAEEQIFSDNTSTSVGKGEE